MNIDKNVKNNLHSLQQPSTGNNNSIMRPSLNLLGELKYDIEGIEALSPRRESVWNKISQASFLTINEKRAELGYPPLKDGDMLSELEEKLNQRKEE